MKCLRRFILPCRGSHSLTLHALRSLSLYFLKSARFLKITDIRERGVPEIEQPASHLKKKTSASLLHLGAFGSHFEISSPSYFCDAFFGECATLKLRE